MSDVNRAWWDERAALHPETPMYSAWIERLHRGEPVLFELERHLMGDVAGLDVLHLPCHIGTDTLSWVMLGAAVTGVDFSPRALAEAARLAESLGLAADWIEADATALPASLHGRFDRVVSTYGAHGWMGDLDAWLAGVAAALKPGGRFVLVDGHPVFFALDPEAARAGEYRIRDPLMGSVRFEAERSGSYAGDDLPTRHDAVVEWCHGVGDLLGAVLRAGLVLEHYAEHDHTVWPGLPTMVAHADGRYTLPAPAHGTIPCMLSIVARKPDPWSVT